MHLFLNCLAICFSISIVSAYGQSSFQVEPSRLFFHEGEPGEAPTTRLKVKNPGTNRLVIRASCADWKRDSVGDKKYAPPGTLVTSCCPFLSVQPETVELNPGEEREVLVMLRPDKPLKRVHNAMLMLTQVNEQELTTIQRARPQMVFRIQIGVHLYYTPKQVSKRSLSIDTLIIANSADQPKPIRLKVNNTGEVNLDSFVRFELTNLQTAEEFVTDPVAVNTLPEDRLWVTAALPEKLTKGRYLVVAIVDSGPETPLEVAELETEITIRK